MSHSAFGPAAVVLGLLASPHARADEAKIDEADRALVAEFLKAFAAKDADALLKLADVPWLGTGGRVIKDAKELKAELQEAVKRPTGLRDPEYGALPFAKAREEIPDGPGRKLFDQVLDKTDRLVAVSSKTSPVSRYVLVRGPAGKAKVVGGPYRMTYLLMPNEASPAAREALEKAEQLELYSVSPERLEEKPKDGFHGWRVLGKTVVKEKAAREKLVSAFKQGWEESEGAAAACFNPRHGIRAVHDGKTVDFVICFECLQVQVFIDGKAEKGPLTADSPQPVFDQTLRAAGVKLAEKADK